MRIKGKKGAKRSRCKALAADLATAREKMHEFRAENDDVISAYEALLSEVESLTEQLKAEMKASIPDAPGSEIEYQAGDVRVSCVVKRGKRVFDASKLIERVPDVTAWKGLLSVKAGEFDKALAAGVIDGDVADAVVSHDEPTKSVSIRPL